MPTIISLRAAILEESEAIQDARRDMEVCNACRYCEGFCAVFPAMELRREFAKGDLNYLANLCHNCKGCYYACQYAPPHEFGINVPLHLARVRDESYAQYAWPDALAALYRRNGTIISLAMAGGVAGVLVLATLLQSASSMFGAHDLAPGRGFYEVIPYRAMVGVASTTLLYSLLALTIGFLRFWKDTGGTLPELARGKPLLQALHDAATLKYLGGGGHGCNDVDESFGFARRRAHHFLAYGFLLCFAATVVATIDHHVFGWPAPYGLFSLPVLLGTAGGIGMMIGAGILLRLKLVADQETEPREIQGANSGLLALLFLVACSGILLLVVRATSAMGVVLAVHLGLVLALFVALPYSKFVHTIYRTGALIRYAIERSHAD